MSGQQGQSNVNDIAHQADRSTRQNGFDDNNAQQQINATNIVSSSPKTNSPEQNDQFGLISSNTSLSSTSPKTTSLTQLKYVVASHSVRITKHGYAIDPIELKYPEIASNLSVASRRASEVSFDATQIGYRMLNIIRGFWSQPAFPKGTQLKHTTTSSTISTILYDYSKNPLYPHSSTYVDMAGSAPESNNSRSESRKRRRRHVARITAAKIQERLRSTSHESPTLSSNQLQTLSPIAASISPTVSPEDTHDESILAKDIRGKFNLLSTASPSFASPSSSSSSSDATANIVGNPKLKKSSIFSFLSNPTSPPAPYSPPVFTTITSPIADDTNNSKRNNYFSSTKFNSWIPQNKQHIYEEISFLCQRMEQIFSEEDRIINVQSPCTVLGDIHGNLLDLRT